MSIIENFKNLDPKTIMITVGIFAMIGGIDTNVNSEALRVLGVQRFLQNLKI